MSYQPYPSAGQAPESAEPQARPPAPSSLLTAVKLMWAGAAVSAIFVIITLVTSHSIRTSLHNSHPKMTSAQLSHYVAVVVIFEIIGVALWVWMALANRSGKNWARITGTVLFGIDTLLLLGSLASTGGAGSLLSILPWLIGLATVIFLWRKSSSEYFSAVSRPTVSG